MINNKKFIINITSVILLTILSLVLCSALLIIYFTYARNYQAILVFSKDTMNRVSALIDERLHCMVENEERLIQSGSYFFLATSDFSIKNRELTYYMLGVLKAHPDLYSYYILKGKKFIEMANLALVGQKYYSTNPQKPLPPRSLYRLLFVDRDVTPPIETLVYLNEAFEPTGSEQSSNNVFNPFVRPWYHQAITTRGLYWTQLYPDFFSGKEGVTAGAPIYDMKGNLFGVIGTYLPLNQLDTFLRKQKIGNTGKAYIVNAEGVLISGAEDARLLSNAYKEFSRSHEKLFNMKYLGITYLVSVKQFPMQNGNWLIVIIVPFLDFFQNMLQTQEMTILISNLILLLAAIIAVYFARKISQPIVEMSKQIDNVRHFDFANNKEVVSHIKEIAEMSASIVSMQAAIRSFSRFVPKEIVSKLLLTSQELRLQGEKKELTIFFLDIQQFTTISEILPLETVVSLLSEYYNSLSHIILEANGTIDKYMGDNIMAFWGAPVDDPNQARNACLAALRCQRYIDQFNQKQRNNQLPEFHARIGIHSGMVIVGNIGTEEKMNYTIIGDPVNTASRLEQLVKTYHSRTIVSEDIYSKIGKDFLTRPLDYITLRGKAQPMKILELIATLDGDPALTANEAQIELATLFTEAYDVFFEGNHAKAKTLFLAIKAKFPDDFPTEFYLQRLEKDL